MITTPPPPVEDLLYFCQVGPQEVLAKRASASGGSNKSWAISDVGSSLYFRGAIIQINLHVSRSERPKAEALNPKHQPPKPKPKPEVAISSTASCVARGLPGPSISASEEQSLAAG